MNINVNHPLDTPNFTEVNLSGFLTLYFSYNTPIAFYAGGERVIRENEWSTTTGKHLNWINPDKSVRVSGEVFEQKLEELLKRLDR